MKKVKNNLHSSNNIDNSIDNSMFKSEVKASRITIASNICNIDKFNYIYDSINSIIDYKNSISQYCYNNLTLLISNTYDFNQHYNLPQFNHSYLNSWESQYLFQDIVSHYHESITRYLNKAKYIVSNSKTQIKYFAQFISDNAFIQYDNNSNNYYLDFNILHKLTNLKDNLAIHEQSLIELNNINLTILDKKQLQEHNKTLTKLNNTIKKYHKLIASSYDILNFSINKPIIYQRVINLIYNKKLRLINMVKLGHYKTGTHARTLANAQLSIVKDSSNSKYQYFVKFRKFNKLLGRKPKYTPDKKDFNLEEYNKKLKLFNENNFIFLPIIFNTKRLKQIKKSIDTLLTKDNPQVLIKAEQLRKNKSSRKIHIIFNYKEHNKLGKVIQDSFKNNINIQPNIDNALGIDTNLKHNLFADSNGYCYSDILKDAQEKNKINFINNVNEIVELHSKAIEKRTVKEIYRYEKLLRTNESLLKTYISGLIKNWKGKKILHLVLEDLNFLNDKSYYVHKDIKIKYTRLARLLRIGQIKHWVRSMAEKQGLFTHIVSPAYTSKECNVCHNIDNNNRSNQEEFKCTNSECNHEDNADSNAAKNILNRVLNKSLRKRISKDNVYQCSTNKVFNYKLVKTIIYEEYKLMSEVVTEPFLKQPTIKTVGKQLKKEQTTLISND